jgi:hypothetical protein
MGANNSMPLTPPADESMLQPLDASLKFPDTPMNDQFADEIIESFVAEPEDDVEKVHLITHAKVYAIAEKYVLPYFYLSCLGLLRRMHGCQAPFICALLITAEKLRQAPRSASPPISTTDFPSPIFCIAPLAFGLQS